MLQPADHCHEQQTRVYYEDTDAGGVVYHANYLKFFERGRTDWLRALGLTQALLATQEQRLFVVRRLTMDFRRPARLDELLLIRTRLTRLGRASVYFQQSALLGEELLCDAEVQVCCVDTDTFRAAPLTPTMQTLLAKTLN